MNDIEFSSVLFYADFLSLKAISQPVTDNCKYFFVHSCPINSAFILDMEPIYDPDNKYLLQALQEYEMLKDQYSEDGALSFINDICFIKACGMVDAERMLQCIHMFSTNVERKQAFKEYQQWKNNYKHTHQIFDENGNPQQTECSRFFKHAEESFRRSGIHKSIKLI